MLMTWVEEVVRGNEFRSNSRDNFKIFCSSLKVISLFTRAIRTKLIGSLVISKDTDIAGSFN